jgi:lipoate-protein ligase A
MAPPSAWLRVLDFGRVSPLRSQTLWHAIAYGVSAGGPPTLSFMRPSRPYVCLGYHRRLEEADLEACREAGLPVFRRMVGGGLVYLDAGQQFFQITVPAAGLPPAREVALRRLLAPAVAAFRAAGVAAVLDDDGEITVGEAKVCGHGAGQIGEAVVVVGNLIERFDHEAAAAVLRLPPGGREEVARLMRRFVAATPADAVAFRAAAASAYGEALGLEPVPGRLSAVERHRLAELDDRFTTRSWLAGPTRPEPACAEVKVRSRVWVCCAEHEGASAVAGVVKGRIERVRVSDPELNGVGPAVEASLVGLTLDRVPAVLAGFGAPGRRLAAALAKARGPA